MLVFKRITSSTNTITIDGATTASLDTAYGSLTIISDGSNWWITG